MANYNGLKATINANIKANNNQEITGVVLNSVLNEIVDSLGEGYIFKGIASTSTNPGSPDEKVFYLGGKGTYSYFGQPTILPGNLGVFWYDSSWHSTSIDVAPVIEIVNNLTDGGVDKALSAEMGVLINDEIINLQGGVSTEQVVLQGREEYDYRINGSTGLWEAGGTNTKKWRCQLISLSDVRNVSVESTGGATYIAFLRTATMADGVSPDFSNSYPSLIMSPDGTIEDYFVPEDANYLYCQTAIQDGSGIKARYNIILEKNKLGIVYKDDFNKVIFPKFLFYPLTTQTGEQASTYRGTGVFTTVRYIAVIGRTIGITLGAERYVRVYEYGAGFSFIGAQEATQVNANTRVEFTLGEDTAYIKLVLFYDYPDATGNAKTTVKVDGSFPDVWDVFNPRPADAGYRRVMIPVRVTDPTCCDEETDEVQDASQILPDYGVICLPEQYTPTGKPTRLIIYCHGAAVNYSSSVTRFDAQDLDPTYWLAEGYAIMDIEGNPFNNTDEHMQTPQAMDCYVAAYEWAIEYFNLCRDGIFLGGRSMGGGMVFGIVRSQCPIPVIAACPNVPSAMSPGSNSNERQQFFAVHCGFDIPAGFDWSTNYIAGNIETAGSKKKLFLDNWDKLVKNVPIWAMATDLPIDEENRKALVNNLYVQSVDRKTLWGKLHILARCPIKLFGCNQDETCPPPATSALYYRMLINAGQIAELRLFNSYKDYSGTGTSAHHYDTQDPALRTDITTTYGQALTNVPIVYIEMLEFWRRYEQGN